MTYKASNNKEIEVVIVRKNNKHIYFRVKEDLKIGKRYLIKEVELIVLALQGNELKVGDLESRLQNSLSRSQVKYLLTKLMEDGIVKTSGQIKGTRYLLLEAFADLRGDLLVNEVVNYLRSKYE